jgi:hypothetical protein
MTQIVAALFYIISGSINAGSANAVSTYYLRSNDTLLLTAQSVSAEKNNWYMILPVKKNYEITSEYSNKCILYTSVPLRVQNNRINVSDYAKSYGTYYFACIPYDSVLPDTFSQIEPLNLKFTNRIVQVVIRRDDSYLGYLTEMFNAPFVLPPVNISPYGHQTDLRIGCDCAELAIYGKRRQGYKIPYCGPMNIYKYLDTIYDNKIFAGCIIHFGDQVSVVYEDNGIPGTLDKDDLLIQSYTEGVEIVSWEKSKFYLRKYIPFKWKEEYE